MLSLKLRYTRNAEGWKKCRINHCTNDMRSSQQSLYCHQSTTIDVPLAKIHPFHLIWLDYELCVHFERFCSSCSCENKRIVVGAPITITDHGCRSDEMMTPLSSRKDWTMQPLLENSSNTCNKEKIQWILEQLLCFLSDTAQSLAFAPLKQTSAPRSLFLNIYESVLAPFTFPFYFWRQLNLIFPRKLGVRIQVMNSCSFSCVFVSNSGATTQKSHHNKLVVVCCNSLKVSIIVNRLSLYHMDVFCYRCGWGSFIILDASTASGHRPSDEWKSSRRVSFPHLFFIVS